ncbi:MULTISPECIES: type II toxin-antitoxin system RelE/ParE family toxin [Pandoraea]|uniref:mRNA interferase RelE n=1 Tax=Pandoraea cepalis TaxID=2508294 RepID=A0A5E4XGX9_9BURK|nr:MULTISPECIES: type II toxin-antitoxin system RelE/ParE family toxin [Pandoraea]QBC33488.1 type II toxin-antitoxin system mRNA interferase toxin, RelE/StbE family [Pandoraea sp. XY-2]VVE35661.1 mRNA interferase RelE [Pandoraea cepalis]
MTTYDLRFLPSALKEWRALDPTVQRQFKAKLRQRLQRPQVSGSRLRAMPDCYKIKLAPLGYRLVYRVDETAVIVLVVAVGKRENRATCRTARRRVQ